MEDSYYYYQKVPFFEHIERCFIFSFIAKNIIPFILPISLTLAFSLGSIIPIIMAYIVPVIWFAYDFFSDKVIDNGELIFFKEYVKISSNQINKVIFYSNIEQMEFLIKEYEGQKKSMFSTSLGLNNKLSFVFDSKCYEFEIRLKKRNIEYLYEIFDDWNSNNRNKISLKNKSYWRFFIPVVTYK